MRAKSEHCSYDKCVEILHAKELCRKHYLKKWQKENREHIKKFLKNKNELVRQQARDRRKANPEKFKIKETAPARRFSSGRKTAKSRGHSWELTLDQWKEKILNKQCWYCDGALPEYGHGLDRRDNAQGYTYENVVACCQECNRIKGHKITYNEMIEVALLLLAIRKGGYYEYKE